MFKKSFSPTNKTSRSEFVCDNNIDDDGILCPVSPKIVNLSETQFSWL